MTSLIFSEYLDTIATVVVSMTVNLYLAWSWEDLLIYDVKNETNSSLKDSVRTIVCSVHSCRCIVARLTEMMIKCSIERCSECR